MNPQEILAELLSISRDLVGVYFDAVTGFDRNRKNLEKDQIKFVKEIQQTDPNYTISQIDEAAYIYGEGDPNISMPEIFHYSTQKEYKNRNSSNGKNYQFIGNMCLITIYSYWEDFYRGELAKLFGIVKNDIKADLFGDLRLIRHSIIHHNSIALQEIKKCKILKWFKPNDNIYIDKDKLLEIIKNIQDLKFTLPIKNKA